jgi:hypothetical protein
MVAHRQQREYQWRCWVAALEQARPPAEPPERVRIRATLFVKQLRDEDNADASRKWVLDALRQKQGSRTWRQGLYEDRGYFVDDDPAHCSVEKVVQEIDRVRPRLEIEIEELTPNQKDA